MDSQSLEALKMIIEHLSGMRGMGLKDMMDQDAKSKMNPEGSPTEGGEIQEGGDGGMMKMVLKEKEMPEEMGEEPTDEELDELERMMMKGKES